MVEAGHQLPYSQSCENNKGAILSQLETLFADYTEVLELGSGTGQHASWFASHMPWLQWQPTEMQENLPVLAPRCLVYEGDNLLAPLALDVSVSPWPVTSPKAIFTANTLHIMPFASVQALFDALGGQAVAGTLLVVYGPFNYGGRYTSESNARFDQWLAAQHPLSAIRDFEEVDALAQNAGFSLEQDNEMPANNRLLVWRRLA